MSQLHIHPDMLSQFKKVSEVVEIRDTDGSLIGYFVPQPSEAEKRRMEPQISKEEIDRRVAEGGGRTLSEIMADLEKRA